MTVLHVTDTRLTAAFSRYERAAEMARGQRAGTPPPSELVSARLDLALLLLASGDELPEVVEDQVALDAEALLRRTDALTLP